VVVDGATAKHHILPSVPIYETTSTHDTMNQIGYLFTAGVTVTQMRPSATVRAGKSLQSWDSCMSAIIYGADLARAQQAFEDWCHGSNEGEDPAQTEIKKIVAAQVLDQLLTESGREELDLSQFPTRVLESISTTQPEDAGELESPDLQEGYWVDINQVIRPECARLEMESLKRGLPEDISSGLNWSPDRKFIFLVSSLSPPPVVTYPLEELAETKSDSREAAEEDQNDSELALEETTASMPELREKEAAALIEARNSVVAAWLWWRYAENTGLVLNELLVSPCCQIIPASA
jgi:hypothetical protein